MATKTNAQLSELEQLQLEANKVTVFENHRKSRIQHCERSEQRLHFEWKSSSKMPKIVNLASF